MRTASSPRTATLLAGLLAVTLVACGNKNDNRTAGEKLDAAVAKTGQAAEEAKAKTAEAGSAIADKIDDATITASVSAGLAKDPELSAVKIDVDTKGGTVMLNGPAPTAAAKARAADIARSVKGVNSVENKLEVKTM